MEEYFGFCSRKNDDSCDEDFDCLNYMECEERAEGIYFFRTKEEAEDY